ncbi:MAG: LLM class flavin-dependent oxidoreductase [Actinobacteria bacterium]|nr:LLM class flavin-dependent oxidoreductase [Actinomycetota bacterium]
MRYGFVLPGGTASLQVEQAVRAEQAGWDGVFVWEAAYGIDAWVLLSAMAQRTQTIKLGTMLTPLPWRRPWKVASQAVTLDELSNGRAILTVGLGATDTVLGNTGEVLDRKQRAEMLDEGIDMIAGMWAGDLAFSGQHYQVDLSSRLDLFGPAHPVQTPRIPIWVVGAWPRPRSMRRVLRCDGLLPYCLEPDGPRETTPDDIRAMIEWLDANGGRRPGFDVVMEGETPADDSAAAAEIVRPWADAGCTWWLDARWGSPSFGPEREREVNERLEAGPPRIS